MFDRDGLYLEVSPRGGKWWRLKYRFAGKEKRVSLGVYPEVNLKKARARTIEARQLLEAGVDPSENRRAAKAAQIEGAANSFEVVTREWIDRQMKSWVKGHGERILTRFRTRPVSLDRRSSDCGSDSAGTADNGEAHRKTRRAGDRTSRARQLRPSAPLCGIGDRYYRENDHSEVCFLRIVLDDPFKGWACGSSDLPHILEIEHRLMASQRILQKVNENRYR
jgi:Arm DNA-binding domain